MAELSLVSINIERSKHLDRVIPFLKQRQADVVCVQELMEYDIPLFEKELGMVSYFAPMTIRDPKTLDENEKPGTVGVGIFSCCALDDMSREYYAGNTGDIRVFDDTSPPSKRETETYVLVSGRIIKDEINYSVCTTHFTWSPKGEPNDDQRRDSDMLLELLKKHEPLVLVGDFNAPRPGEIFTKIASVYKDNIPPEYKTSIDASLHRNGAKYPRDFDDKMVDGLFTTPEYGASDVALYPGVSDHMAVTAMISRTRVLD